MADSWGTSLGGGTGLCPQRVLGPRSLGRGRGTKSPEAERFVLYKQLIFEFPRRY